MICSIIAGGLSVKNIDDFIGTKIGVNYTFKHLDVDINFGLDKVIGEDRTIPNLHSLDHHGNTNLVKAWKVKGLDFNRDGKHLIQANNSGIAAINLAIQLGYKTIYVLGMDNKLTDPSHFYANRITSTRLTDQYNLMFQKVNERIGNCSLLEDERLIFVDSEIKHFENITAKEYNNIVKKSK